MNLSKRIQNASRVSNPQVQVLRELGPILTIAQACSTLNVTNSELELLAISNPSMHVFVEHGVVIPHVSWLLYVLCVCTVFDSTGHSNMINTLECLGFENHHGYGAVFFEPEMLNAILKDYSYDIFQANVLAGPIRADGKCLPCHLGPCQKGTHRAAVKIGMCSSPYHCTPRPNIYINALQNYRKCHETIHIREIPDAHIDFVASALWSIFCQHKIMYRFETPEHAPKYYFPDLFSYFDEPKTPKTNFSLVKIPKSHTFAETYNILDKLYTSNVVIMGDEIFGTRTGYKFITLSVLSAGAIVKIVFKELKECYKIYASPDCDIHSLLHI